MRTARDVQRSFLDRGYRLSARDAARIAAEDRRIRSWDDPAWAQTDDPYRLIRALSLGMVLEVVAAAAGLLAIFAILSAAVLVAGAALQ